MRSEHLLAILFLLSRVSALHGAETATRDFDNQRHFFKITFPADWGEIPPAVISDAMKKVKEFAPQAPKTEFAYAYHLMAAKEWLSYPYVLIEISRRGRIADALVLKVSDVRENVKERTEMADKFYNNLMSNSEFTDFNYDQSKQTIFFEMKSQVLLVGEVYELTGCKLTDYGTINVHCCCTAAEYAKYKPVFTSIISSLNLDPVIKYVPKVEKPKPDREWVENLIIGGIVLAIITAMSLISQMTRRKQRD